jgi:hypothetical protein
MELPSINLPKPLESALLSCMSDRSDTSTGAIVQEALEEFLRQRGYLKSPTKKLLQITPASKGSGYADTSVNHDLVMVEFNAKKVQ